MSNNYYSIATYQTGGAGSVYTVPFPYIRKDDVYVFINGGLRSPSSYEWTSDSTIQFTSPVSSGVTLVLRRYTRRDERWAEYNDGSTLTEHDLNIVTKQLLFLTQELYDLILAGNSGGDAPPGGIGPGGGEDLIREIVNSIVADQLLANLTELIRLIDINAEAVIGTILANHQDWSIERAFDYRLSEHSTAIQQTTDRVNQEAEQRITQTTLLGARLTEAEGSIVETQEAAATLETALASFLREVSALFGGNVSGVTTLEQAFADANGAFAQVVQQIEARLPTAELENYLNLSQVVTGIRARISETESSVEQLNSSIAQLGSSLGAVQSTVAIHATQLSAEAAFRTAVASRFGGTATNPSTLAAAIESAFRTYADSGSVTAGAVQTLQANTQPIFFRAVAPDWTTAEFATSVWKDFGFPEGSLWFQESATAPGFYIPYRWKRTTSTSSNQTSYPAYGPYGGKPGVWLPAVSRQVTDAVGALSTQIEDVYVREDEVGARVNQQLQAVYGPDYAALSSRLQSWINPETGLMYTGWDLRINQTGPDGVPVMAGIGLGMQRDLNNPEAENVSAMIVMADQFSVIKPPPVDPITGEVDISTVIRPFVVDTQTGTVGVDGKLLVRGSLNAYDGTMGRLTIGQINDVTGELIDPNGIRLTLPSSRNNWNSSNAASPFVGGSNPQKFLLWAGTGTMNHNNSVFYVDTDGNAAFKGVVYSANVSGDFNDGMAINHTFATVSTVGNTGWVYTPGSFILDNRTGQSRVPFASIGVSLFGSGQQAGRARVEMQEETGGYGSNVWGSLQTVAEAPLAIPIGTTLTLSGGLTYRTSARVKLVVSIARQQYTSSDYGYPSTNHYSGIFIGLR